MFACGRKHNHIWVFDKRTCEVRRQSLREVAHENLFYEHPALAKTSIRLEERLAALEGQIAPQLKRIVTDCSLRSVDAVARESLLDFFLVQLFRTQSAREYAMIGHRQLTGSDLASGLAKMASLQCMVRNFEQFRECCSSHILTIREASGRERFILSDHPVGIQATQGATIECLTDLLRDATVLLPISPSLMLLIFPPSRISGFQMAGDWFRSDLYVLDEAQPAMPGDVASAVAHQVFTATRFLFSNTDDFSDVRRLLKQNPLARTRPLIEADSIKWPESG